MRNCNYKIFRIKKLKILRFDRRGLNCANKRIDAVDVEQDHWNDISDIPLPNKHAKHNYPTHYHAALTKSM